MCNGLVASMLRYQTYDHCNWFSPLGRLFLVPYQTSARQASSTLGCVTVEQSANETLLDSILMVKLLLVLCVSAGFD